MFKKLSLLAVLCPLGAFAIQLDWSGYYSVQETFSHDGTKTSVNTEESDEYSLAGTHRLALDGVARISDGLVLHTNLSFQKPTSNSKSEKEKIKEAEDLNKLIAKKETSADTVANEFTRGYSKRKYRWALGEDKMPGLGFTHFYTTYTSEYFELTAGRMPYNFGIGITYSEGKGHVLPVYDVRDGVAFEFQVNDDITLKPYIIRRENAKLAVALEAQYEMDDMGIGVLYENTLTKGTTPKTVYPTPLSYIDAPTLNVHGYYNHDEGSLNVELGGLLNKDHSRIESIALVGELEYDLPVDIGTDPSLALIAGYVQEGYSLNVNYHTTSLFWPAYFIEDGITDSSKHPSPYMMTDTTFAMASVGATFNTNYNLKFYYSWLPGGGHEVTLGAHYDSKKGLKWENFLFVLTNLASGLEFSSMPYVGALSRVLIKF